MKQFGVVTLNECEFELDLLKFNDNQTLPIDSNVMFELYIQDRNGYLIDVPVLITNFKDAANQNEQVNQPSELDINKKRLVHRFFMYDTVSGIDDVGGYRRNDNPQIVRYAQSVKLSVELALDEDGKIHKPILEITYWE